MIKECHFLEKYVLVGGSALALHLCHRKSEDLNFFTYGRGLEKEEIFKFIQNFKNKEILNQSNEQIDLLLDGVKVTFFDAKWEFLKPTKTEKFNLTKKMNLTKIFENSKDIIEGIDFKLFAVALLYIDDIEDDNITYLEPIEIISKEKKKEQGENNE